MCLSTAPALIISLILQVGLLDINWLHKNVGKLIMTAVFVFYSC